MELALRHPSIIWAWILDFFKNLDLCTKVHIVEHYYYQTIINGESAAQKLHTNTFANIIACASDSRII